MSERITQELRMKMDTLGWYDEDGSIVFTTGRTPESEIACLVLNSKTFGELCDAIDAIHANLERENDRLKCELDRVLGELDEMHKTDGISDNSSSFMQNAEYHAWAPESHYMLLPKDTDSVPIHVGDVMEWVDIEGTVEVTCTVEAVGVGTFFAWDKANGRYAQKLATSYRHHKPDTWEQIIEDACKRAVDGYPDNGGCIAMTDLVARCKALAGDAE